MPKVQRLLIKFFQFECRFLLFSSRIDFFKIVPIQLLKR